MAPFSDSVQRGESCVHLDGLVVMLHTYSKVKWGGAGALSKVARLLSSLHLLVA